MIILLKFHPNTLHDSYNIALLPLCLAIMERGFRQIAIFEFNTALLKYTRS